MRKLCSCRAADISKHGPLFNVQKMVHFQGFIEEEDIGYPPRSKTSTTKISTVNTNICP